MAKVKKLLAQILKKLKSAYLWVKAKFEAHPIRSFVVVLGLLFLVILGSNFLSKPKGEENAAAKPKEVVVYSIGEAPRVSLQGQVEKSGVVPIVAQTQGVVQTVNLGEGDEVGPGTAVVSLSSNYQGANASSLQRQIAKAQFDNIVATYQTQLDLINTQRSAATASAQNAENLKNITNDSIGATQSLIDLNSTIINSLNANISELQANNTNGVNDALILSTQQILAGVTAGQNQAQSALRSAQYQTDNNQAAAQLPEFQKDIALKQLDIQEKGLNLSRELSRLQLRLAEVSESLMFPSSPFRGVIQKIFVKEGQLVSPGMTIAVVSSNDKKTAKVTVFAPKNIADRVSKLEPSTLSIGTKKVSASPVFISTEAVSGSLFAITYIVPDGFIEGLTDKEYISVEVPVGYAQTVSATPYIPIDVVYQTPETAYVYLAKNGRVVAKNITLGQIFGSFVEVDSGLNAGDKIIVDRTVIAGDKVKVEN